jgi:hypothetical protein
MSHSTDDRPPSRTVDREARAVITMPLTAAASTAGTASAIENRTLQSIKMTTLAKVVGASWQNNRSGLKSPSQIVSGTRP